jgi:hypothetical protein
LTFVLAIVSVIQAAAPSKALQLVNVNAPRPRGYSIKPDLCEFIVPLVVFWACWYYSGDTGDMPHHLLRVTGYVVGAWVVFAGLGIAYIITMRVVVWWRWTQTVVAQHEKRLAEENQGEACQASASQPEAHLDPAVFHNREVRRERRAQARRLQQAERRCQMAIIQSHPWHATIVLTLLGIAGVLFWTVPPKVHLKAEPAWQAWPISLIAWILVVYLWRFEELTKRNKTDTSQPEAHLDLISTQGKVGS